MPRYLDVEEDQNPVLSKDITQSTSKLRSVHDKFNCITINFVNAIYELIGVKINKMCVFINEAGNH